MTSVENSLQRDFPLEYAVVAARPDSVLCGFANELFGGRSRCSGSRISPCRAVLEGTAPPLAGCGEAP
ncbi:hypothetical protein AX289_27455 [Methylorubrum populi]|nr:hypothetical protein AX289_27455 [Methylorubrum populi]